MHALVYVLIEANSPREAVDDLAVLNELPYADYTEELPIVEGKHFTRLAELLSTHFGKENIAIDRGNWQVTINRTGIIRYFNELRARIYNSAKLAMDKPIEDFIHMRGETDWYAIKTLIDDPFDTQFYLPGYCCGSVTTLAHNLYVLMGYEQAEALTLELTQVFDYHY